MLAFYWSLGRDIVEMHVEDRWGEKVIDNISIDLKSVMPDVSGLTRRNIYYCKQFYLLYSDYNKIMPQSVAQNKKEIVPQVVAQLHISWRIMLFSNELCFPIVFPAKIKGVTKSS
jgi:hypothetical protein